MHHPHITKEVLERLYVTEGKSTKAVAKELGTSSTTICRHLKLHGIPARPFSTKGLQPRLGAVLSEETKEKIRQGHLGKKLSEEHRLKVIASLRNGEAARGENNPIWKGGKSRTKDGYVLVRCPNHPNVRSNGYYPEHRLVMEKTIGRYLLREEVVHHKNGNKTDNRPENLELTTHSDHAQKHWCTPEARKAQSDFVKEVRKKKFWSTRKK